MSKSEQNNRVSRFESLIREYFKYFYTTEEVIYNYRPDWLKNPNTGYNLEIDIYFPNLKLGIECNGGLHELDSQIKRDIIKRELCIKEGVNLISIKYPHKILKMQQELGLVGELPKSLYYQILNYKASKKAFGRFTKKIKKQKRMRVSINLQDKEREFNRQKMLRNKS
jgi:hypothetical protein